MAGAAILGWRLRCATTCNDKELCYRDEPANVSYSPDVREQARHTSVKIITICIFSFSILFSPSPDWGVLHILQRTAWMMKQVCCRFWSNTFPALFLHTYFQILGSQKTVILAGWLVFVSITISSSSSLNLSLHPNSQPVKWLAVCVSLSACVLYKKKHRLFMSQGLNTLFVHAAELCEFFICTAVTAVCINAFKWNYRTCSYYYRWSGTWLVDNVSLLFYQPSCTKQILIIYLIISSILFLLENNISPFIVSQLPAGCVQLWTWIREHVFCMLVKAISHVGIKSQTVSTLIFFSWLDECFQSTLWVICQNKQSFDHSWLDCCMQVHMLIHTTNQERMDQNFQSERGRLKHLEDRQKQKDVPVGGIQAGRKNEYAECAALFQFTKKYPIFL